MELLQKNTKKNMIIIERINNIFFHCIYKVNIIKSTEQETTIKIYYLKDFYISLFIKSLQSQCNPKGLHLGCRDFPYIL